MFTKTDLISFKENYLKWDPFGLITVILISNKTGEFIMQKQNR